jgi:hypothetical protein
MRRIASAADSSGLAVTNFVRITPPMCMRSDLTSSCYR